MWTSHKADVSILWAKKWKVVQKKGLMVVIVLPILQRIAKDAPQYIISSEDWKKCMWYMAEQRRLSQLQWLPKVAQCFALFDCCLNNIWLTTNISKVFVDHREYVIRAINWPKVYIIPISNHGDTSSVNQRLIGPLMEGGIRNADTAQ